MSIDTGDYGNVNGAATARGTGVTNRRKRLVRIALGGTLVVTGLRRRSFSGTVAALGGGWLLYRALGGRTGIERLRERVETAGRGEEPRQSGGLLATERSITVGKPAEELYELWRDPETLARVMVHFADVGSSDPEYHHWEVRTPVGTLVSWDTEIVEERHGEFVRWTSVDDADVRNEGSVQFQKAPDDRGTEVVLTVRFDTPGGTPGDTVARYLGVVPGMLAMQSLRRFKSLAETGEISTLEGNPSARGTGDLI